MGNCKSCFDVEPQTATVIDSHGRLRQLKSPITAAELMLEESGHVVSPETLIRRTRRLCPMKADEELSPGRIYLLVPTGRANSRVSESEMELLDYATKRRRRHKVLPTATGDDVRNLSVSSLADVTGLACAWRPALEPIFEESGDHLYKYEANF